MSRKVAGVIEPAGGSISIPSAPKFRNNKEKYISRMTEKNRRTYIIMKNLRKEIGIVNIGVVEELRKICGYDS
ncbi:hypothetical protein HYV50_00380 [Candidatus Pacearchaeota archaeon]|nr:hypothetical protein [Candidatus Pacearchaeota archaeon]